MAVGVARGGGMGGGARANVEREASVCVAFLVLRIATQQPHRDDGPGECVNEWVREWV